MGSSVWGGSFTATFPVDPAPPLTEQPPQLSQVPHGRARPGLWNQGLGAPSLLPSLLRALPHSRACTQVLCLPGSAVDKWVPSTQSTPTPLSGFLCLDQSTTREQAPGPPGTGKGVIIPEVGTGCSKSHNPHATQDATQEGPRLCRPAPISRRPPVRVCAKLFCPEKAALGRAAQTPASPPGARSPPAPQLLWEVAAGSHTSPHGVWLSLPLLQVPCDWMDIEGDDTEMLPTNRRRRTALLRPGVSEASGACPPPPLAGSRREEGRSVR